MTTHSKDSYAILLLCSDLAMPKGVDYKPFTLGEWQAFSQKLKNSPLARPEGLFTSTANDWREQLDLSEVQIERIQRLLARGGQLGIELERLANMGVWVVTRADAEYPQKLKRVLVQKSPAVLFCAGDRSIFNTDGVAIVGSRDVDQHGAEFTEQLARKCANENLAVVSGGAKGVDSTAQDTAIKYGGRAIAVLADGLEAKIIKREIREAILDNKLLLVSSFNPKAHFKVYTAMERNKYIYGLGKYAVIVSSAEGKGGTWSGAIENIRAGWVPLFVRSGSNIPAGNKKLLDQGAFPITGEVLGENLRIWFEGQVLSYNESLVKVGLFKEGNEEVYCDTSSFSGAWPCLEKLLNVPRSYQELADLLNVPVSRIKNWLREALELGRVKKLTQPVRFISAQAEHSANYEQKRIFDLEVD